MLQWAFSFLILATASAIIGFGGIASGFAVIGQALFVLFLVLFFASLLTGALRPPPI